MKIYNTLTRQKEEFVPLAEGEAKIYACGPTVYNYIHIGNARPICVFDVLRRYLEYRGMKVTFVQNFTDIDDKIIRKANEEGSDYLTVSRRYMEEYKKDAEGLNIRPATIHPRATENIDQIIGIVSTLMEKGYAYATENGDVYFRTLKFEEYGKLSHQPLEDLQAGARISVGEVKEDPMDFALWKAAKPGEPMWEAPWGKGRPGWHIECSAMARRYLGETIDLHCGGQDLIFPHHENEIAQSECCNGVPFARYWMHNGYVTIGEDDEKMSKSLGNFITVHEMIQKVDPQILRFFMSTTQYRRPIRYSESTLKEAAANYQKLKNAFENLRFRQADAVASLPEDEHYLAQLNELEQRFITEMDDDFNAANGITVVYELAKMMNQYSEQATVSEPVLVAMDKLFSGWLAIFGLFFKNEELVDAQVDALIEERNQARKDRDFARSDEIRDLLKEQGIVLEDTPQGTRWRRSE